jgi:hypothetical protein
MLSHTLFDVTRQPRTDEEKIATYDERMRKKKRERE